MNSHSCSSTNLEDLKLVNLKGLGPDFFKINRENFIKKLKAMIQENNQNNFTEDSLLFMTGGKEIPRHDTDTVCYHFIQESYFYYLTGVELPDFNLIVNLKEETFTLFMKTPTQIEKIFVYLEDIDSAKIKYGLDCLFQNQVLEYLEKNKVKKYYRLSGINSDSKSSFELFSFKQAFSQALKTNEVKFDEIENLLENSNFLYEVLAETRVIKSDREIEILQYTSKVTCEAHIEVMKKIKPGCNERDAENYFISYLRNNYYTRDLPYLPICGCGENGKVLHYQGNDAKCNDGEMFLMDMGTRLGGYCSDITMTVPINGKFTEKQKGIYMAVLNANRAVMNELREGVNWGDMHILAERSMLKSLQNLGLLKSEFSIDEMMEKRICFYFQFHGLGHFLGLDVHDVGGYLSFTQKRSTEKGLRNLRTQRNMKENMIVTIEPGCYFIESLLNKAFSDPDISKYFNVDLIKNEYLNFGGVRIEDDVWVRKNDCVNLSSHIPRTVEDIEETMKSK